MTVIFQNLNKALNDYDFPNLFGTLTSYNRPLVGGINIVGSHQSGNFGCTTGFSGILNNKNVLITNSHCTDNVWNLSSYLTFFQNFINTDFVIGTEYKDPKPSSCGFLSLYKCRKSDAAAIEVLQSEDIGLGLIARTNGTSWDQTPGSTTINNSNKVFSIVASSADQNLTTGQIVHKMGRKTGWTSGKVAITCIDVKRFVQTWWKLECQYAATYYSDDGDSGAPVFSIVTTSQNHKPVFLYGINFGRNIHENDLAYFSPMSGIRSDLGDIEARDPNFEFDPPGGGGGGGDPGPEPEPCEYPDPCQ